LSLEVDEEFSLATTRALIQAATVSSTKPKVA